MALGNKPRGATPRPMPQVSRKSFIPLWLWGFFCSALLVFLAIMLYLWQPWRPVTVADTHSAQTAKSVKSKKSDYQFYDLLPKQQVLPVPADALPSSTESVKPLSTDPTLTNAQERDTPQNENTQNSASDSPNLTIEEHVRERRPQYILQIKSFDNADDADRQRGEILLTGQSADIRQTQDREGVTWYRVVSGPYLNRAAAVEAQKILENNGIDSIVVEQP